jgi:hypothetical protein
MLDDIRFLKISSRVVDGKTYRAPIQASCPALLSWGANGAMASLKPKSADSRIRESALFSFLFSCDERHDKAMKIQGLGKDNSSNWQSEESPHKTSRSRVASLEKLCTR